MQELAKPTVFGRASLGKWSASVTWGTDALELAADSLCARATEQAGGCSHELILNWRVRHGLTLDGGARAQALGLSRRMLAYYRSGEKPVPLACLGWEAEQRLVA